MGYGGGGGNDAAFAAGVSVGSFIESGGAVEAVVFLGRVIGVGVEVGGRVWCAGTYFGADGLGEGMDCVESGGVEGSDDGGAGEDVGIG